MQQYALQQQCYKTRLKAKSSGLHAHPHTDHIKSGHVSNGIRVELIRSHAISGADWSVDRKNGRNQAIGEMLQEPSMIFFGGTMGTVIVSGTANSKTRHARKEKRSEEKEEGGFLPLGLCTDFRRGSWSKSSSSGSSRRLRRTWEELIVRRKREERKYLGFFWGEADSFSGKDIREKEFWLLGEGVKNPQRMTSPLFVVRLTKTWKEIGWSMADETIHITRRSKGRNNWNDGWAGKGATRVQIWSKYCPLRKVKTQSQSLMREQIQGKIEEAPFWERRNPGEIPCFTAAIFNFEEKEIIITSDLRRSSKTCHTCIHY